MMKTGLNQKINWGTFLPVLAIILGILLLIYMIIVEDEPGAVPLVLIFIGTLLLIKNRLQHKKTLVS